jgi:hypothetical protein
MSTLPEETVVAGNMLLDAVSVYSSLEPGDDRAQLVQLALARLIDSLPGEVEDGVVHIDATALVLGAIATVDHLVVEAATALGEDVDVVITDTRIALDR